MSIKRNFSFQIYSYTRHSCPCYSRSSSYRSDCQRPWNVRYGETVENITKDNYGVYSVQSLFREYAEDNDSGRKSIDRIRKEVSSIGYHFKIIKDGLTLYSDITNDDIARVKESIGRLYGSSSEYTIISASIVIIHSVYKSMVIRQMH